MVVQSIAISLHVASAVAWVGGMFLIYICLRPALGTLEPPQRLRLMRATLAKFLPFVWGAIVVILSDGWDRGDPAVLDEQMTRLHRVAHKVVWVNPLKVTPGYAPLARGMAAALPHVDAFVEGHSLDAMERLAHEINTP